MAASFTFPTEADFESWGSGRGEAAPDSRTAFVTARRVRRNGWMFTTSALAPTLVAVAVGLALQPVSSQLSTANFWVLFALLAVVLILTTAQWRTIVGFLRPDVAVEYYASACINRLRQDGTASEESARYLSLILPELERHLLSPQLSARAAGTTAARRVVSHRQTSFASSIGRAEEAWRRRRRPAETAALVSSLGRILAVVAFNCWFDDPTGDFRDNEAEVAAAATWKSQPLHWLSRLSAALVAKGTDLAVGSLGSLLLLVIAAAQRP